MSYVSQKKHMQNCLNDLRAFSNNQTAELKALSDQVAQLKEKEKRFELMGGNLQGRLNKVTIYFTHQKRQLSRIFDNSGLSS